MECPVPATGTDREMAAMTSSHCPSCGAAAPTGRTYCSACGAPLAAGGTEQPARAGATLPPLPEPADPLDPFRRRADAKARSPKGAAPGGPAPATTADAHGAARPPASRRWALAVVSAAVLVVLAGGVVLAVGGSDDDSAATEVTTGGAAGLDPAASADPPAPATTAAGPAPAALPYRHHVARHYEVEVPDTWRTTYDDRVLSRNPESLVSRWEDPFRAVLSITTSSPLTGTLTEDCTAIFDDRARSAVIEAPHDDEVQGRSTCSFAYTRADAQVRVEHLFTVGDREFLITAGADTEEEARALAAGAVGTLEPR